jgi:MoaA/NifB/PqqE/SkfB family radical SAM enzyme
MLNPLFEITDINLETFKEWFPDSFIKQLNKLFMCGNLGDPIIGHDCLEIFQHLREVNPSMLLAMHTNGSARNISFWETLAKLDVKITFGIDGLEDTHKLYRIDTDFNKIIENATAFINAGGYAEWHMLAFEHNEHQIGACQHMADMLGFKKFTIKHTSRFKDDKLNVIDDTGKTTHVLRPTQRSKEMMPKIIQSLKEEKPYVSCKVQNNKEIYVSANGTISPCCWLDFSWILPSQDSRIDYMDKIGKFPTLREQSLESIFNSGFFNDIANTWQDKPLMECSRQCGSFDKCGEQFK